MKHNPLLEQLKKSKKAPFYQCPRCRTVWLVVGGPSLNPYTCKMCGHHFDLSQTRYTGANRLLDSGDTQLPDAA
jgi:hypothetical protein